MEKIIEAVDKNLIKAELTEDKRLRMTNKSQNHIYIITNQDSPNVMREIGRLREIAFRAAGGGTGKALDIDEFDTMDNAYKQLIVWDPEADEILGGYRYILGTDVKIENGVPRIATSHLFNFSDNLGIKMCENCFYSDKYIGKKSHLHYVSFWDRLCTMSFSFFVLLAHDMHTPRPTLLAHALPLGVAAVRGFRHYNTCHSPHAITSSLD